MQAHRPLQKWLRVATGSHYQRDSVYQGMLPGHCSVLHGHDTVSTDYQTEWASGLTIATTTGAACYNALHRA